MPPSNVDPPVGRRHGGQLHRRQVGYDAARPVGVGQGPGGRRDLRRQGRPACRSPHRPTGDDLAAGRSAAQRLTTQYFMREGEQKLPDLAADRDSLELVLEPGGGADAGAGRGPRGRSYKLDEPLELKGPQFQAVLKYIGRPEWQVGTRQVGAKLDRERAGRPVPQEGLQGCLGLGVERQQRGLRRPVRREARPFSRRPGHRSRRTGRRATKGCPTRTCPRCPKCLDDAAG
jgi:hypothetical protein